MPRSGRLFFDSSDDNDDDNDGGGGGSSGPRNALRDSPIPAVEAAHHPLHQQQLHTSGSTGLFTGPLPQASTTSQSPPPSLSSPSETTGSHRAHRRREEEKEGDVPVVPSAVSQSRRTMRSLFAQDALQGHHGVDPSMRYNQRARREDAQLAAAAAAVSAPLNDAAAGSKRDAAVVEATGMPTSSRSASAVSSQSAPSAGDGGANGVGSGGTPNTNSGNSGNKPSPLRTVKHAVVQAYRAETYIGTCVVALCVPNTMQRSSTVTPILALVDANKQALCRTRLDRHLRLVQSTEDAQYVQLYDPSWSGYWSLMFRSRAEAAELVVAALTIVQYRTLDEAKGDGSGNVGEGGALASPTSAAFRTLHRPAESAASAPSRDAYLFSSAETAQENTVREGRKALLAAKTWLLQRVASTLDFTTGKVVDEVPVEAPCEVLIGAGAWMTGVEEAAVGMVGGETRLVFVPPGKTNVRHGVPNPEVTPSDTVVVLVTCVEVLCGGGGAARAKSTSREVCDDTTSSTAVGFMGHTSAQADARAPPQASSTGDAADSSGGSSGPSASVPEGPAALLQRALLSALGSPRTGDSSGGGPGAVSERWSSHVDRSLDRIQLQLSSLYEKLDRIGIEEKLAQNNAAIELVVRRALGTAPSSEVAVEDAFKDRDSLLASVEKYKARCEESQANYEKALEAINRYAERVHGLENDLRVQKETLEARLNDVTEHDRLVAVERTIRHREELEQHGRDRYAEGLAEGRKAGIEAGRRAALSEVGSHDTTEWKAKLLAQEQAAVRWQSTLQEAQSRHQRERRQLEGELHALRQLCEKQQQEKHNSDVRVPEETTDQQCRRIKRALNAVYANVETQLEAMEPASSFSREDALAALVVAIKAEAEVFVKEIRSEAAVRGHENDLLRQILAERQAAAASCSAAAEPTQTDGAGASFAAVMMAGGAAAGDTQRPSSTVTAPQSIPLVPPPPPPPSAAALFASSVTANAQREPSVPSDEHIASVVTFSGERTNEKSAPLPPAVEQTSSQSQSQPVLSEQAAHHHSTDTNGERYVPAGDPTKEASLLFSSSSSQQPTRTSVRLQSGEHTPTESAALPTGCDDPYGQAALSLPPPYDSSAPSTATNTAAPSAVAPGRDATTWTAFSDPPKHPEMTPAPTAHPPATSAVAAAAGEARSARSFSTPPRTPSMHSPQHNEDEEGEQADVSVEDDGDDDSEEKGGGGVNDGDTPAPRPPRRAVCLPTVRDKDSDDDDEDDNEESRRVKRRGTVSELSRSTETSGQLRSTLPQSPVLPFPPSSRPPPYAVTDAAESVPPAEQKERETHISSAHEDTAAARDSPTRIVGARLFRVETNVSTSGSDDLKGDEDASSVEASLTPPPRRTTFFPPPPPSASAALPSTMSDTHPQGPFTSYSPSPPSPYARRDAEDSGPPPRGTLPASGMPAGRRLPKVRDDSDSESD